MTTAMQITTLDENGVARTRKISDVNPTATNVQLKSFARTLVALTDRTYAGGSRIIGVDLNDQYPTEVTNNG